MNQYVILDLWPQPEAHCGTSSSASLLLSNSCSRSSFAFWARRSASSLITSSGSTGLKVSRTMHCYNGDDRRKKNHIISYIRAGFVRHICIHSKIPLQFCILRSTQRTEKWFYDSIAFKTDPNEEPNVMSQRELAPSKSQWQYSRVLILPSAWPCFYPLQDLLLYSR